MTENTYLTQTQLAERWQVAESTLERWRSEGIGPIYMKMMGRVRYRLSDITDFEE
ncbi:DNA-binding protein, partial [bacterium]|nr:DNA-binding protein [bacterium]